MTRDEIYKLSDEPDNVLSVLTRVWIDADNGDWPKQNSLQCKSQCEDAIRDYLKIRGER